MRRLTLCLPYYMNAGMLAAQLKKIANLPEAIRDEIAVNVVDDGSPDGDAAGRDIGCPLKIYKIGVDVRWNQDAARNIAAHHAVTPWLLLTDIDHMVPRETFGRIVLNKLNKKVCYRFARTTLEADGETETPYKPHPNSWLLRRTAFWEIGGYDERFAGYYGTDAEFRDRLAKHMPVQMLPEHLIRVPRTTIPDASTTTYVRKEVGVDDIGMKRVRDAREALGSWRPLNLTFPYKLIGEWKN